MDMSSDCIENYLEFKDEEPGVVANKYIEDMAIKYGDYKNACYGELPISVIHMLLNTISE